MEDKSTCNGMIIYQGPKNQIYNGEKKRKRFSLFKTAMVMFRGRPSEKPKATKLINVATTNDNFNSDENWKKIVGSVRPLHSQDIRSPPPQIPRAAKAFCRASTSSDDDFFGESPALSTTSWGTSSPALSTSSWGTSSYGSCNSLQELTGSGRMKPSESTNSLSRMSDNMSRYASALNLHDLDVDEEVDDDVDDDNDNDNILEICEVDDMIDSKADEFIARFYDQMKSQE